MHATPAIFDSDKKQKFGISNTGEFIDNTYREQNPSKLLGRLIGRNSVEPNAKQTFTSADIVCESYIHKKGSWLKNWKRRYFILRRDIRCLCYYDSKENLTLLGALPLDIDMVINLIPRLAADGFDNVISIQVPTPESEKSSTTLLYLRFDDEDMLRSWTLDLKNESLNMTPANDHVSDWWTALFDQVKLIEIKSNALRRDGHADASVVPQHPPPTVASTTAPPPSPTPTPTKGAAVPVIEKKVVTTDVLNVYNDEDSDGEDNEESSKRVGKYTPMDPARKRDTYSTSSAVRNRMDSLVRGRRTTPGRKETSFHRKGAKVIKPEKPPGPPPFDAPTVKRFETADKALSGLQVSLRLCNVCAYQDRLFVVLFGILPTTSPPDSKWTQLSRTELRTVDDRPIYGENYVSDYRIHFSAMEDLIPDTCKDIRVVVYRQENEMMIGKELSKATNLKMQHEIAKCIIPKKLFDAQPIIKCTMPAKVEIPMDIAVPLFKDAEITLGIVNLKSYTLYEEREQLREKLDSNPYAEILYSFATQNGKTLSLEQLYASKYSISATQALVSLWQLERNEHSFDDINKMRNDLNRYSSILISNDKSHHHPINDSSMKLSPESINESTAAADQVIEQMKQAIDHIENILLEDLQNTAMVLENCDKTEAGVDLVNNVLDPSVGGGILRRSVWKKITCWQYAATNLNLHLLVTKVFSADDLLHPEKNSNRNDSHQPTHCIPSVTVGCPAAHELKFGDGGLRKFFSEITDTNQKLKWIYSFQSPKIEHLKQMFQEYPKEAQLLFGSKCNMQTHEDFVYCYMKKLELGHRIDVCASQALACALLCVRTLLILATMYKGKFLDSFARSIKIGFLVTFQSMLSTQGAELGMIEDLDLSALWLNLVSIRFVVKSERPKNKEKLKLVEEDDELVFVGKGDGVYCRRDKSGRLIVDLEITGDEGLLVLEALRYMGNFHSEGRREYFGINSPLSFNEHPNVPASKIDDDLTVYAVASLFAVTFTQGVNEMQTLANLSSSRDVLKQAEINSASLHRLQVFYKHYKAALEYQMNQRTAELVASLEAPLPSDMGGTQDDVTRPSSNSPAQASLRSTLMIKGKSIRQSINNRFTTINAGNHNGATYNASVMTATIETIKQKVMSSMDRLLDQLKEALSVSALNPYEKHVNVLLNSSALCREVGGIVCILCKSGKDRTSMGVTLENTRSLVEDIGALQGQDICQIMRMQGVRRMNVYANTGQSLFAFNQIQRIALPPCYRPPHGCHGGNVQS